MSKRQNTTAPHPAQMRIQKFLSDAGVASRRRAEELVRAGRVLVNDEIVDELPIFVDPQSDRVIVDGRRVRAQAHEYFIINKPRGFVCTDRDPGGRRRVIDLLPKVNARVFLVGRLDIDSSGLIILTNDGELAERIAHPRYGLPKVYHVELRGEAPADIVEKLQTGVYLADGKAQASEVLVQHRARDRSVVLLTLREGRNRLVRRLFAKLGFPVRRLKRVQIGPLVLKGLAEGACRRLSQKEVDLLRAASQRDGARAGKRPAGKRPHKTPPKPTRSKTGARVAPTKPRAAGRSTARSDDSQKPTQRRKRRIIT